MPATRLAPRLPVALLCPLRTQRRPVSERGNHLRVWPRSYRCSRLKGSAPYHSYPADLPASERLAELFFKGDEGNTLGAEIARRALPTANGPQPHWKRSAEQSRSRLLARTSPSDAISPKERPRSGLLEKFAERGPR